LQARKLEGEVDSKLAQFSKLGALFRTAARCARSDRSAGGDKPAALLDADQVITSRGEEIEALLQRLSDVNDAMCRRDARAAPLQLTHLAALQHSDECC